MSKPTTQADPSATTAPGRATAYPGPRGLSSLGSAFAIQRDPIHFSSEMWQRYGDFIHVRFLHLHAFLLYHPNYVQHVILPQFERVPKAEVY